MNAAKTDKQSFDQPPSLLSRYREETPETRGRERCLILSPQLAGKGSQQSAEHTTETPENASEHGAPGSPQRYPGLLLERTAPGVHSSRASRAARLMTTSTQNRAPGKPVSALYPPTPRSTG